jgi:hypothetical protein
MSAQLTHDGIQDQKTERTDSARHGRLRGVWERIRATVQEMNYATRRVVEVQAPWSVDEQWRSR